MTPAMNQLIAPQSAERVLLFLAVAGPLVGVILGIVIGAHERCAWPSNGLRISS